MTNKTEYIPQAEREKFFNELEQGETLRLVPCNEMATVIKKTDAIAILQKPCGEKLYFFKLKIYYS